MPVQVYCDTILSNILEAKQVYGYIFPFYPMFLIKGTLSNGELLKFTSRYLNT
jgi:hypothetical protein